ncbi:MAG: hypothetical protein HY040_01075 [Planctomycetes bacterium]|nr:hypothetical protein [Planctomycetota bacterium]
MFLEGIIVSVDYGDFLAETLPRNLAHFDRLVVVTQPEDGETIAVCKKHGVPHVSSNFHLEDGEMFNKGRLINLGISHLRHEGWLLQLDADIVLPERLRHMLRLARLDPNCIYGADRFNSRSFAELESAYGGQPQWRQHYLLSPPRAEAGQRLVHWDYGYCPIGYFQLWHGSSRRVYPINAGGAEHSDVVFATQWDRRHRILLPEVICLHLEQGNNRFGSNWNGRTSPPWQTPGGGRSHPSDSHYHKERP